MAYLLSGGYSAEVMMCSEHGLCGGDEGPRLDLNACVAFEWKCTRLHFGTQLRELINVTAYPN